MRDVLVGKPVESIAPYAALGDRAGECECLRYLGLDAVECGVEARDLWQLRRALEQGADRREIVRLVQRRERNVLLQRREHFRVDANRPTVFEPAMDDTMA